MPEACLIRGLNDKGSRIVKFNNWNQWLDDRGAQQGSSTGWVYLAQELRNVSKDFDTISVLRPFNKKAGKLERSGSRSHSKQSPLKSGTTVPMPW